MKKSGDDNGYTAISILTRDKRRLDEFGRLTRRGLKDSISKLLDLAEQHDPEYRAAKERQDGGDHVDAA